MSIIFVLVGQCGTQVGGALCRRLPRNERTHHSDGCIRCVGVDTEPKVIGALLASDTGRRRQQPLFRRSNFIWEESGRGNNWAFGYTGVGVPHGERATQPPPPPQGDASSPPLHGAAFTTKWQPQRMPIIDRALSVLDEEVARAGFVEGLVFLHSLAGGTGSGLGSRLLEECRARYEGKVMHFVSAVMAPHRFGDTSVSSLNSLLTVNHLLGYSDLILWVSNQQVSDHLSSGRNVETGVRGVRGGAKQVSLVDINEHIATCLLLLLQHGKAQFVLSHLVTTLAPHASHKIAMVSLRSASSEGWGDVLRAALLPFKRAPCVGVQLSVSSWGKEDTAQAAKALEVATQAGRGYANIISLKTHVVEDSSASPGVRHIATAATVPSSVARTLILIGNQAGAKVYVGAYLHWYAKYGVTREYFLEALRNFRHVIEDSEDFILNSRKGIKG